MLAGFSLLGTAVLTIIAFTYLGVLPKADFIANVTTITEGDSVNFTYTGSENYTQQTYYWDFGDGTTSTGKDPIHIYETIGKFTVSVTVVDKDGDFDTETKTDYIEVTQ